MLLVWFPGLKSLSMAWRVTPPMSLLACSWGVWFFTELLAPMDHLSCPPDVGSQGLHCCFQPDEAKAAPLRAAEPVIPWQTRQSPGHRAGWDLSNPKQTERPRDQERQVARSLRRAKQVLPHSARPL